MVKALFSSLGVYEGGARGTSDRGRDVRVHAVRVDVALRK